MSIKMQSRISKLNELLEGEPSFRFKQIQEGLLDADNKSWDDISNIPKKLREEIKSTIPFFSFVDSKLFNSKNKETYKSILTLVDGESIETVLMKNKRGHWTICVSSQVGCAMRCGFCATGKMGFKRNLLQDEIIDQYRFWNKFVLDRKLDGQITNIVFMGMGEPMANYENVRSVLNDILQYTDIGPTRITVSTVGMLPQLENLLKDPLWPHVRLAVSLHSADKNSRKEIVPTSYGDFHNKLKDWSKRYLEKFGNRKHHLTFEYVMIKDVNDNEEHARKLANFVNQIGEIKVNLIPYNLTGSIYKRSLDKQIEYFKNTLRSKGVVVTQRKTMGDDIEAACGQLIVLGNK